MLKPDIISNEEIYQGRIFQVHLATVKEGETVYKREIITHPGSAVIVPLFADKTVALVRQYRHPARKYLLELPAGSLSPGEDPQAGALRELEEEIGVTAGQIQKLTEFYISPGFLGEKMYLYLATGLQDAQQNLEDDELISIERVSFEQSTEMISGGQIEDAKTIIGLTMTAARFGIYIV